MKSRMREGKHERSLTLKRVIRKSVESLTELPEENDSMNQQRNSGKSCAWLIIAAAIFALGGDQTTDAYAVGFLKHQPIAEASGIIASRQYPGIFWVHNDSGNKATLFAVRSDGTLVNEFAVAAPNVDWEDIAIDDRGHLYIGDIGNNNNRLPLRCIYRIDEPNPNAKRVGTCKVTLTSYYKFPESGRFDAESLFVAGKNAYLIAKQFDGRNAEIYAIPLDPPAPLFKPAIALRVGELPGFDEPATGADLSANGRWLAVCSNTKARVYERVGPTSWKKLATIKDVGKTIEAICWDGSDLLLAGENRLMYRIPEQTWRAKVQDR